MAKLPRLKIFLSSPGDVAEERALAEIVFRRLADEVAEAVKLETVLWEHEPLFGHAGFQQQIQRPSQCDLVVTILWSRAGTRLPSDFAAAPGQPAPTGTEFEIQDALDSYAARGKPQLLIYRKIPGPQIALGSSDFNERSEQYQRLEDFCRRTFFDREGAAVVAHHTFSDGHEFEHRLAEHVRRWLDREIQAPSQESGHRPLWRGQSPFRGLQSFEAEHQSIFFGRGEAVGDLMRRIRNTEIAAAAGSVARLLIVQGMSGAGKTSLFKAGILPLLALRPVEGIARWISLSLRPAESEPALRDCGSLGVLAARLCAKVPAFERLGIGVRTLAELLVAQPQEAVARIESCVAAEADESGLEPQLIRLFIYVDQLEEALTLPDAGTAEKPFLRALAALANSDSIWAAATVRSDFVHRLEEHPDLMQCLSESAAYTLLAPRADELGEMIREPAKAAGLTWEQRDGISLDQQLLRDATGNPEALPLLEYSLAVLYERREGRMLRWDAYGGGLKDALISAADEVVQDMLGEVDLSLRDVMRELVGVGEDGGATRRYASLSRFPVGSAARALLERLIARRLCVTTDEGRGDGPVVYLAHEALIRSWPRAQAWLERETTLLRIRDELARDAAVWEYHGRGDDWLGVAPEKIAAIRQVEAAGLMPSGAAGAYAAQSKRRRARNVRIRRVALAGMCTLTVLAGIAWWLALQQRNVARTEAATADRTTQFMVSLFKLADPNENRGAAVTVKEVLDKGAREIRSDEGGNTLQREPRVRAELLTAMGEAYQGLGLYSPSEDLLSSALTDVQASPAESQVRTLSVAGVTLYLAGKYQDAETKLQAAVELARGSLPRQSVLRSNALTGYANVLVQLDRIPEAIKLCEEALAADRKRGPKESLVLAQTLDTLSSALYLEGNLTAAEPAMREALALRQQALGMHHALTASSLDNLGVLLYQSGRYDESIQIYEEALPIFKEVYGGEHPEVSTIINNIGRAELMAGHLDAAEPLLRQALTMTEKFKGESNDDLVSPLNSLAMIDGYRGRLAAAAAEIERAAMIARLPDHGNLLDQVLLNQADIELAAGNRSKAAALLAESRALLEKTYQNDAGNSWRYAVWDAVNAQLLAANGNAVQGMGVLAKAQSVITGRFGESGFYAVLAKHRADAISRATHTS